jgi:hypothetical protein
MQLCEHTLHRDEEVQLVAKLVQSHDLLGQATKSFIARRADKEQRKLPRGNSDGSQLKQDQESMVESQPPTRRMRVPLSNGNT